jgi:hypothetical protein
LGLDDPLETPFLNARVITTLVFGLLATGLCVLAFRRSTLEGWLEAAFLTIAWFWLLSPTQNPWYWTWAMALLPFARSRLWLLISGLTMLYYARFWLQAHFDGVEVMASGYSGEAFFDLVVTWIEFGPWLVCLLAVNLLRQRQK